MQNKNMESPLEVLMRVPGLFIIDFAYHHYKVPDSLDLTEILVESLDYFIIFQGFLLLLLPIQHVQSLYRFFISLAFIFGSHTISNSYINAEMKKSLTLEEHSYSLKLQIFMLLIHGCLGSLVSYLLKDSRISFAPVYSVYGIPVIGRMLLPIQTLPFLQNVCDVIISVNMVLYIISNLALIINCAKVFYMETLIMIEIQGFGALLSFLQSRLLVPPQYALLWLIEFAVELISNLYHKDRLTWGDEWYIVLLTTISAICASPVTLVATSFSIAYLSSFIMRSTRAYLQGTSAFFYDNPMHSGWTEGLTHVLLSYQIGLTDMKMPGRMAAMTIILFIVLSSLLQSMLEIAEPVVLALSALRNRNLWRHFRALSLCFSLLLFPLYLTRVLSSVFPIDFWMMIVLSSCILTSVQVIDLLIVHSLFLYDSFQSETWENLDDIVYYTRAVTKVLEFLIATFVVGMGLWETTSGKWNLVNASILLFHCYFNVWQRLQTGWKSFLLRREAAKKAKSLPEATHEQLSRLDDVCSICFSNMHAACVTHCNHYFHRTCLQKWLYVQDKCPLCHSIVMLPIPEKVDSATEPQHENELEELNNPQPVQ